MTLRLVRALARQGDKTGAVALCRELLEEPSVTPSTLQAIAEIAHDEDDAILHRSALELLVRAGSGDAKRRALERLGDFQFTQLRDPRARPSRGGLRRRWARASPAEQAHAQTLYERVLEALPDDRDSAPAPGRASTDSRTTGRNSRAVLRVLVRTDLAEEGPARLLLELEKGAIDAGAAEEYVALIDEVLARGRPERRSVRAASSGPGPEF